MSDTLHEGPGCMVHIPSVIDQATGDPIALTLDCTLSVTYPDGSVRTFARTQDNVLTSSVGFNLYLPETTVNPSGMGRPGTYGW